MAGRTKDRELLALARTNKTPALQGIDTCAFQLVVTEDRLILHEDKNFYLNSKPQCSRFLRIEVYFL